MKENISLYLSKALIEKLKKKAKKNNLSLSKYCESLLEEAKYEKKKLSYKLSDESEQFLIAFSKKRKVQKEKALSIILKIFQKNQSATKSFDKENFEILIKTSNDLSKIKNNLNQIAKAVHTHGYRGTKESVENIISKINKIIKQATQ